MGGNAVQSADIPTETQTAAEAATTVIDASKGEMVNELRVPTSVLRLEALANVFGASDDGERSDLIEKATRDELSHLVEQVDSVRDEDWDFLHETEESERLNNNYVKFSALMMAYELARYELKNRDRP